ncbi:MAG TPA: hypothetical protein EYO60_06285 [Candidatus Lambdaproteobacteria bacterium]|nr:hypothetical protein [Candidatus Lambdaproteobacteria bacterium]
MRNGTEVQTAFWPGTCFYFSMSQIFYLVKRQVKMNAQLAKSKAILNGSLLIALYFVFWIVVAVVLPILSIGLRLYTKEQGILKDHTQEPGT